MSKTILQCSGITKRYGVITAINNLHTTIKQGEVWGVLGPNGSGKTTTLAVITGIIKANSGNFTWFDQEYKPELMKSMGILLETPNFYPYMSLVKNLKIYAKIKGVPESDIPRVLKLVNLYDRRKWAFQTMSLGMKQRLALATCLLGDPDVLILDEPTNGLDPQGISEVREIIINEAKKGKTIILASHILSEVEKICTHVAILKKGNLLASGKVSNLLDASPKFILVCKDAKLLGIDLEKDKLINSYEEIDEKTINVTVTSEYSIEKISKRSFELGYTLLKIEAVKDDLEKHFMEIIK
ncbi:MAG: ATP-binding cassette domain-containing protein [Bacteroidales bacterium]|jgi:ABC-2 type transport system ATP-binding protein|nr:ATP-binding cassette domain-containing protein [Bacteroidales bacterium]